MTGRFKARLTILPGMIGSRGARLAGEAVSKGSGVVGPIVYLRSIVCEGVSSTVHLRGHLITEVRGSTIECKNELGLSHDVALLTTTSQARQRSTRHDPRGTLHDSGCAEPRCS